MVLEGMLPYCRLSSSITDSTEVCPLSHSSFPFSSMLFMFYFSFWTCVYFIFCLGKLDKRAVLRAICSGFEETTEPDICLTQGLWICTLFLLLNKSTWILFFMVYNFWLHLFCIDIQTNQCLENNGGCWLDKNTNFTACKVQLHWGNAADIVTSPLF